MMPAGTYRLKCDVTNPRADRRERYDWRKKPGWAAGTEFIVKNELVDDLLELPAIRLVGSKYGYQTVMPGGVCADLYKVLEAALEPVAESCDALITRLDVRDHFAQWLLRSGAVSRELFERLWSTYETADADADHRIRLLEVAR